MRLPITVLFVLLGCLVASPNPAAAARLLKRAAVVIDQVQVRIVIGEFANSLHPHVDERNG